MICKGCGIEMRSGTIDGKPGYVCLPCGKTLVLPSAKGSTIDGGGRNSSTPTNTLRRSQVLSPGILEPNRGIASAGERSFLEIWTEYHPDLECVREYKFSLQREFRADFAWVSSRVAVEIDSSAHRTKERYASDIPKHNAYMMEGWVYFRCTRTILEKDAERFCRMVSRAILEREK